MQAAAASSAPNHECQAPADLDGLVVHGRVRARGLIGLVSVPGELSFQGGMLVWATGDSEDVGPYAVSATDCLLAFTAEHVIENGEHVRWSGVSDGRTVSDVTAIWTRVEGDFVHDLLLPEQVTLDFTPDA